MLQVTVAYSPAPREVFEQVVSLPEGATARDGVMASSLGAAFPQLDWQTLVPGVWGRAVEWDQVLADLDRVELCRPLVQTHAVIQLSHGELILVGEKDALGRGPLR